MLFRLVAFLLWVGASGMVAAEDGEELFVRRVAPVLAEKCLACHGQDAAKIKGGYDLRSRKAAVRGGDSGSPGLVPGKPTESPLFLASLRSHDDWEPMPPKEADKLTPEQTAWIEEWIATGAPWPDAERFKVIALANEAKWSAEDGVTVRTAGGLSEEWTNRKYRQNGLWAYQQIEKPKSKANGPAAVDEWLALHFPENSRPAAAADAATFIRRATFDLTGLPPTPEEVRDFIAEHGLDAGKAIRGLIERLLDSPHYGERMAQHWLDVARYADSSGYANDYERGNAWRYRDYVIRAFNEDKPYDRFAREQIAGDEIDPADPEMLVATGFLRMGPWELTGMEVAKVARQRFLDDVTNSVGEVFLAHSLQCARCHDHKFDPVPTGDYYAIQAVFSTTQLAERPAPFLKIENLSHFDEKRYLDLRAADHRETLQRLDGVLLENARKWFRENGKDPARWNAAVEKAGDFSDARAALTKAGVPEGEFPPKLTGFTPEQFGQERVARKGLERLKWEMERYQPFALAVYTGATPDVKSVHAPMRMPRNPMTAGEIEKTHVLTGGDPFSAGAPVVPGTLSVLGAIPGLKIEVPETPAGRRAAFAEWVAHPRNPLTARTIVNRIWMWHFGEPLAGNPNNFGTTGKRPTHPELLDWLAAAFVESGWSIKSLHQLIMNSEAYRRSSIWEGPDRGTAETAGLVFRSRRLSAEELRDAMLAVSGELNRTAGGIPNRPEINHEAALQPRQVMGTFAAAWVPNPLPEQRHRRSIYALKLRGLSDPQLEVFNAPAPDFSCERREASTVTPQVFALFNSQGSHSRALALASRVLGETRDDGSAVRRCFELALGRAPRPDEAAACLDHWRSAIPARERDAFPSNKAPLSVRREAVEENTGEKFSFDEKLHAYADFVPDRQPADCDARTRALADVCLVLLNTNEFAYVY